MKAYLFITATAGFLAVSQTALFPHASIFGVRPDLILLAVISAGLLWGVGQSLLIAIAGGLLLDISGVGAVGFSSLALLPVALLASFEGTDIIESRLPSVILLSFIGTVLYYLVLMVLYQAAGARHPWLDFLTSVLLPGAIINSVASLPVFGLFWLLSLKLQPETARALS